MQEQPQEPERKAPALLDAHSLMAGQKAEERIGGQTAERVEVSKLPTNWVPCKNVAGHTWALAHIVEHQPRLSVVPVDKL